MFVVLKQFQFIAQIKSFKIDSERNSESIFFIILQKLFFKQALVTYNLIQKTTHATFHFLPTLYLLHLVM